MKAYLTQSVIYRGRLYEPGETITADPETMKMWEENEVLTFKDLQQSTHETEAYLTQETVQLSAPAPPGIVESGSGSEGEMPGRDSRRKR